MSFGKVFSIVLLAVFLVGISTGLKENKCPREIKVMVKETKDILKELAGRDELGNKGHQRNFKFLINVADRG